MQSHLVGPPFPTIKACFSATSGCHFPRALIKVRKLVGVVRVMLVLRMAEMTSGSSFKPSRLRKQKRLSMISGGWERVLT